MPNHKKFKHTYKSIISGLLMIPLLMTCSWSAPNEKLKDKYHVKQLESNLDITGVDPKTRYDYVSKSFEGIENANVNIELFAEDAVRDDGNPLKLSDLTAADRDGDVTKKVIVWDDKCGSYVWNVEIPETAVYEMNIEYMPFSDETIPVMRDILIDGQEPFYEARNVLLPRAFYESEKVALNSDGDEIAPALAQMNIWLHQKVMDLNGYYEQPLKFLLSKGKHTIAIAYATCDIYLSKLELTAPTNIKSYEEYLHENEGFYDGESIYIEAETADLRSVPALRRIGSGSPDVSPFEAGKVTQNIIGGWYWRQPHDTLTYVINAPKSGYYKLAMNIRQDARYAAAVFRQIKIDGIIPFKEVTKYKFSYTGKKFEPVVIGKDQQNPYLFYLTEGKHELSLSVVLGDYAGVIDACYRLLDKMTEQYREIITVTSIEPDQNYNYELDKKIPKTIESLKSDVEDIQKIAEMSIAISGETPATSSMKSYAEEFSDILSNVETLPGKLDSFLSIQSSISVFAGEVSVAPMALDYISLMGKDTLNPVKKGTFKDSLAAFCMEFIRSFTKDYDGNTDNTGYQNNVLEVWIANSRDYGDLLQRLANDEFTENTGIKVNVNILPAGSVTASGLSPLMLTVISGNQPDIVVGSDGSSPVDLAIRDAVVDLSKFKDFDKIKTRFLPGTFEGITYNGGVYALPLTMDLPVMFYRTDIMSELGLRAPDTWEELRQNTFPSLKQSQYSFYLSSGVGSNAASGSASTAFMNYSMFLYQNGGDFYSADGLKSELNSDAAYRAFKQWTDLYLNFDIDVQADLLNHFRQGDIPLAMGTLYDYTRIQFAAPELHGRWSIVPVPGMKKSDGTIDRTAAGSITTNIMFDNGEQRKEAAFKFLDWWTSKNVQMQFANEIETIVGIESRWFSANVDAFKSIAWNQEHLKIIMDWTQFFKTQRNVLGGYLSSRTINNSWNETVLHNKNAREQIEKAYKETTLEMVRKQKEYGVK